MDQHRQDRYRFLIVVTLSTLFIIWPLFHMVWATRFGLNATKLAGWGMYAVVRPREIGVTIIFLDKDSPLDGLDLATTVSPPRMLRIENGAVIEEVALREFSPKVDKKVEYVQVFRAGSDVQHLVHAIRTEVRDDSELTPPIASTLVLVYEPRVSLGRKESFTQLSVYLSRSDHTRFIGVYESNLVGSAEILTDIRTALSST